MDCNRPFYNFGGGSQGIRFLGTTCNACTRICINISNCYLRLVFVAAGKEGLLSITVYCGNHIYEYVRISGLGHAIDYSFWYPSRYEIHFTGVSRSNNFVSGCSSGCLVTVPLSTRYFSLVELESKGGGSAVTGNQYNISPFQRMGSL